MGFYAIWPFFVGSGLILALASTPLLRPADPPSSARSRVRTIDGLRGFLALSVFFHHASVYHGYLLTGTWAAPPARFYANLGPVGVSMFFMITGYLFWMQMLEAQGRPDWFRFYVGRGFRIVPLYLLLAFIVLLSVGFLTSWQLQEQPIELAEHVFKWLAGGMLVGGDVNAVPTGVISAGVTWTLHYEWMFYASLPVISLVARRRSWGIALPGVVLLATASMLRWYPAHIALACASMFLVGMTVASARHVFAAPLTVPQWILSTGVIGCFALVLLGFANVYAAMPISILGIAFGVIVFGTDVFGTLSTRPARRLGEISYGLYLLQGPTLFLAFAPSSVRSLAGGSAWGHWATVMLAAAALVLFATLAHSLLERPGIKAGHRAGAALLVLRRSSHAMRRPVGTHSL